MWMSWKPPDCFDFYRRIAVLGVAIVSGRSSGCVGERDRRGAMIGTALRLAGQDARVHVCRAHMSTVPLIGSLMIQRSRQPGVKALRATNAHQLLTPAQSRPR